MNLGIRFTRYLTSQVNCVCLKFTTFCDSHELLRANLWIRLATISLRPHASSGFADLHRPSTCEFVWATKSPWTFICICLLRFERVLRSKKGKNFKDFIVIRLLREIHQKQTSNGLLVFSGEKTTEMEKSNLKNSSVGSKSIKCVYVILISFPAPRARISLWFSSSSCLFLSRF